MSRVEQNRTDVRNHSKALAVVIKIQSQESFKTAHRNQNQRSNDYQKLSEMDR